MKTHLSARIVWHDRAWDGHICDRPSHNPYCVVHEHVREQRVDALEDEAAGKPLCELDGWRPPCCRDPIAFSRIGFKITHHDPLERSFLLPIDEEIPPYSVCPSPYRWMLEVNFRNICEAEGLDIPGPKDPKKAHAWVMEPDRQMQLLTNFWGKLRKKESLVFFYCKNGHPFSETATRLLVGVGRISEIGPQVYFGMQGAKSEHRFPIWSRRITHDYENEGVRLPYQEYLRENHDPTNIICPIPEADTLNFSYVGEHITDDVAVGALERILQAVQFVKEENKVSGNWSVRLNWLNDALSEVWRNRGPFPGIGSVLQYLGFDAGTAFHMQILVPMLEKGENAWDYLSAVLAGRQSCEHERYEKALKKASDRWQSYSESRRRLLSFLVRFELTPKQLQRIANPDMREESGIVATDDQLLENPCLICEMDQGGKDLDVVGLEVIDRGMRPEQEAARFLSDDEIVPQDDPRRVRAVAVTVLQNSARTGDTLLPFSEMLTRITKKFPERRACIPDRELVVGQADFYNESLDFRTDGDPPTMALRDLSDLEQEVRSRLSRRVKRTNDPPPSDWDWERLLKKEFGEGKGTKLPPEVEKRARKEKAKALTTLYEQRFCALTGRAGTGKTSVLKVFLDGLEELEGRRPVLLLAPTGKARVRLMDRTKRSNGETRDAYTIHQFLMRHGWINPVNFALNHQGGESFGAPTVIVDEASMIPMDLLGVLFRALDLNKVSRLILVGDPNQLPPIGPGRPFVDIIAWLEEDEHRQRCLAKLSERARHEEHNSQALLLADCFLRQETSPGDDAMLSQAARQDVSGDLEVHFWRDTHQLEQLLSARMKTLLQMDGGDADYKSFNTSLGVAAAKGKDLEPTKAESWQILSPVRSDEFGTTEINRNIQLKYKIGLIKTARRKGPRPFGEEEIVWTDKVIQTFNRRMKAWPRGEGLDYVANGEIGLVVSTNKKYDCLDVGYSTQPDAKYRYYRKQVGENLELAYALTVHKAQGSDFDIVFLVLPRQAATLSRELLYTGLTRFRKKMVLLIQQDTAVLENMRKVECSDTLLRNTNLFVASVRPESVDRHYANHLIHRTDTGVLVRSKSEVIVANTLTKLGISYEYEQKLSSRENPNDFRLPDFTVSYEGDTFYWEHLGMLSVPSYQEQWEKKELWYKENGFHDRLITSQDGLDGSIDSTEIEQIARKKILLED